MSKDNPPSRYSLVQSFRSTRIADGGGAPGPVA